MTAIRILSYNIHKGLTPTNQRFVLDRMRTAIRNVDADVVFLQEVQGEHRSRATKYADWPTLGQCEFLADGIWTHHAYGRNALYDHGHHGNAILSRYPFISWENIDVSTNRWERRGLLHGVVKHPALTDDLHLICCHLDLFERGRQTQVGRLINRIAEAVPPECPLLVAGDFNDWRAQVDPHLSRDLGLVEVHRALHGKHARSFPVWWPLLHLDRMYMRGLTSLRAECLTGEPWRSLSDHAPLLVEVG